MQMLTSSRREYIGFFPGPPYGIVFSEKSEKNFLAINFLLMKLSADTQINAFFVDI